MTLSAVLVACAVSASAAAQSEVVVEGPRAESTRRRVFGIGTLGGGGLSDQRLVTGLPRVWGNYRVPTIEVSFFFSSTLSIDASLGADAAPAIGWWAYNSVAMGHLTAQCGLEFLAADGVFTTSVLLRPHAGLVFVNHYTDDLVHANAGAVALVGFSINAMTSR